MRDLAGSIAEQRTAQNAEGMCKTAADLVRYRRIIAATAPTMIVECGTYSGKSAVWFAREAGCPVFTIDVSTHIPDSATRAEGRARHVRFWSGSSTDRATVEAVKQWVHGSPRVMVVLDSDHSAPHVLAEMRAYGPLVSPGCYMVVEDGITRWLPEQWPFYHHSPLDAIEVFLAETNEWLIAQDIEDMLPTTQFPSGWLLKVEPF